MTIKDNNGNQLQYPVIFQDQAIAIGDGLEYTTNTDVDIYFEITGTSTSRSLLFEIAGPSAVYVPKTIYNMADDSPATSTTKGSDTAPESWTVSLTAGWSFRVRIPAAPVGGYVTVKGAVSP